MREVVRGLIAIIGILCFVSTDSASALTVTPPPESYKSPVFISAFQTSKVDEHTTQLDVIEIYNDTKVPHNLNGWTIIGYRDDEAVCTIELASDDVYVLPNSYVVIANEAALAGEHIRTFDDSCSAQNIIINKIELISPNRLEEQLIGLEPGTYARKGLTASYRDNLDEFLDNFELLVKRGGVLYADEWYVPMSSTPVQIVEILPHAKECAPITVNLPNCSDYIKFYNPMSEPWDLNKLRLRIGYHGQNVTSGNAVILSGELPPDSYGIINTQADGDPLSITNSGGWVWLEDMYGLQRYDDSVVEYENASSSSREGLAWSLDSSDEMWKWTKQPTPYNQPNNIDEPSSETPTTTTNDLAPCNANQYRNPETNRCKLIASASNELKPCASNQFRNPATNRCKLIASASSSLKPCASNQFRNPETNRCKAIASTASSLKPCQPGQFRNPATNRCKSSTSASSLKPCAENQERNPATNRCRNKVSNISADFPVEAVADSAEATVGWWAFGGVGMLAAGYAGWEWRKEALNAIKKAGIFFIGGK